MQAKWENSSKHKTLHLFTDNELIVVHKRVWFKWKQSSWFVHTACKQILRSHGKANSWVNILIVQDKKKKADCPYCIDCLRVYRCACGYANVLESR